MSEVRHIVAGSQLIYHAIYSQAGSLEKAILENIMNSVDAGATGVDITLDEKTYAVSDNGSGFSRMDEIERFFDELGFDHAGDNHLDSRIYGKFGLGRAQNFAFARTVWRTSEFRMDVDVKHRGLSYEFDRGLGLVEGCTVTGHLYDVLLPSQRDATARALVDLIKYMPIPVRLNAKQVNTPARSCKWHHEDDDAYYKFAERGSLAVYNLGAKVCEYPSYRFGTGGVVVSKRALQLNTARTEILQSVCKVWPRIAKTIRAQVRDESAKPQVRMNDDRREFLARQLVDGEASLWELRTAKLITDVGGRHHALESLYRNKPFTVAPVANDRIGERLHKGGIIFVLSPVTLARFGVESGEQLTEVLQRLSNRTIGGVFEAFEPHASRISDHSDIVADKTLHTVEMACLKALRRVNFQFPRLFGQAAGVHQSLRNLVAGESECNEAWTDGSRYIAIERRKLRLANQGIPGFDHLMGLVIHEYCHDDADLDSHGHDQGFYETFEAVICHFGSVNRGNILQAAIRAFINEMEKAGRKLTKRVMETQDIEARLRAQP